MLPERFWVKKCHLHRIISFVKKSGTVRIVKLVMKSKKHNQLYFGTLVLVSYCYCGDNS